MDITKLMGIWVNYISNITDGTFSANPRMIKGGMLDYMSSIYYFLLQPDGKTIKYWCKYTGCWPTNIPYSLSKFSKGSIDIAEGSITFVYMSKEDMNPDILKDFNKVSLNIDYDLPDTSEGDYSPTRKSSFLTKKGLENAGFALSDSRDPLIFLNDRSKLSGAASGRLSDCYELSFGADSVRNSLFDYNMFGDTGITSIDDYARSEMDDGESGN
jgi:hypothetical protein